MRKLTKDIEIIIDDNPVTFRLTKLDAFSGVALMRLMMRVEDQIEKPTLLDLIASLSDEELKSVMTAVLNHTYVMLPAGPNPVMTSNEWGYPELEYDTPSCMKLLMEGITWSLSGFFADGQLKSENAPVAISH